MFFKKLALFKTVLKPIALKPVISKPVAKPVKCVKQEQLKKLAEKKITEFESKATKLKDDADTIRDKYDSKADHIRDHFKAKADLLSSKGGKLNSLLSKKYLLLGEKQALKLEKLGDLKAKGLDALSTKYQLKADHLKSKLHKDDDIKDDEAHDDDIVHEDPKGDDALPDDAATVKFALSVRGFSEEGAEEGLTNAFITVNVPQDGEEFSLEDAEEAMLDQLTQLFQTVDPDGNQGLELSQINLVTVENVDGDVIAEYQVVDGNFEKVVQPIDMLGSIENESEVPADMDDEDEDVQMAA